MCITTGGQHSAVLWWNIQKSTCFEWLVMVICDCKVNYSLLVAKQLTRLYAHVCSYAQQGGHLRSFVQCKQLSRVQSIKVGHSSCQCNTKASQLYE